jgi:Spy/CpxP family protein refolding chaperone
MMSPVNRWLVSALLVFIWAVSAVNARQSRPSSPPWWKDEKFVSELQLKTRQIDRIDAIWNETAPELFEQSRALDSHERTLSKMIKEGASEARVKVQIDLVESTRARRSTARQFMLYRMRSVMTPGQRVKFDGLHAKWSRDNQRAPAQGSRGSLSSQGSQSPQGSPGSGAKKPESRPATPARP